MGKPTRFLVRVDSDELARWRRAAEAASVETYAPANVSAIIRRLMDGEATRLLAAKKRSAR